MNNCFIILAAGQSKRFKSIKFKQYAIYKNKPIFVIQVNLFQEFNFSSGTSSLNFKL